MLREIVPTRQKADEPPRRWFFCQHMDVLLWEDGGQPVAFQLSYDRHGREHALRWKEERGYAHYSVDDGRPDSGSPGTPILHADGAFPAREVLDRFIELSSGMPPQIIEFIRRKLAEHPEYVSATSEQRE